MHSDSNTMTTEKNHALQNAEGWLESIREMVGALAAFENDDSDEENPQIIKIDGDEMDSRDDVVERITESVLSVQVRGGWHNVGEQAEDEEFEILLTTGGPALRIIGEIDNDKQPTRPRLQYQDWGTPWTERITTGDDRAALQTFCEQFYFGE